MKLYAQSRLLKSRQRRFQLRNDRITDLERSVEDLESELGNFATEVYVDDIANELGTRIDELEETI